LVQAISIDISESTLSPCLTTRLFPAASTPCQTFFDGASIRFNFGIPRGQDGVPGHAGATGATGLAFTSCDPPTQGELTQVLAKLNELIVGLRR
jgi:hypothetical protein